MRVVVVWQVRSLSLRLQLFYLHPDSALGQANIRVSLGSESYT